MLSFSKFAQDASALGGLIRPCSPLRRPCATLLRPCAPLLRPCAAFRAPFAALCRPILHKISGISHTIMQKLSKLYKISIFCGIFAHFCHSGEWFLVLFPCFSAQARRLGEDARIIEKSMKNIGGSCKIKVRRLRVHAKIWLKIVPDLLLDQVTRQIAYQSCFFRAREPQNGVLRAIWGVLRRSWTALGAFWGALGALLDALGALLDALGALLVAPWALLGLSWGALAWLLGALGRSWTPLGRS